MPTLLFPLRNVPEDEADEVRALLVEHDIQFYETSAGNWGISMPALWLPEIAQLEQAQQLLSKYQQQRYITQRELYAIKHQKGETLSTLGYLCRYPLHFLLYFCGALLILYASVRLFIEMGF